MTRARNPTTENENQTPIRNGSKVKTNGEVYIVTKPNGIYKAEKPGNNFDRIQFTDRDLANGDVTVVDGDTPTTDAVEQLREQITFEKLVEELEGRHGLRTSKPDADNLTQYIWRMAVFHSGYRNEIPVMADMWLQTYLDERGIDAKVGTNSDVAGDEVKSFLDDLVDAVIMHFDRDPTRAAQRWQGLAY